MENPIYRIEAEAKAAGLSIAEVCRRAGIARSTMQRWKSGDSLPQVRVLQKIDKVLNGRTAEESKAPD